MRRDVLTGRTALLLAAFAAAVLASVAPGAAALVLVVVAASLAGTACLTPAALRLGRALKPPARGPGRPH